MNRRSFLALLVTVPCLRPIAAWAESVPVLGPAIKAEKASRAISMPWITRDVLRIALNGLSGIATTGTRAESRICPEYPHHFNVWAEVPPREWPLMDYQLAREKYLRPAGMMLADEIRRRQITRFAQLPMPKVGEASRVYDHKSGLSVRACVSYQLAQSIEIDGVRYDRPEHYALRFDVLGAES